MRKVIFIALAAAFALPAAAQQSPVASDSVIRDIITRRVDAKLSTGMVIGVLEPDGKRRIVAYGASGTPRPLDGASVFEIGSITKTFTGILLADMAARGEVKLDDPVAKFLPATVKMPSRNGREITLLDLAMQQSGLPRMPTNFKPKDAANPFADYRSDALYAFLSGYSLPRDVGETYEYSNLGVGLLGHVLALRAGTDYETLVRRRILEPLGMTDTRIALTPAMRERLALGHDAAGATVPNWDLDVLAGAGALRSTVNDMLTYIAANAAADVDSTKGPLAPAMHSAHTKRRQAGSTQMGIGLAWHVLSTPGGSSLVWHNGGTAGYRTFSGFNPATHAGVVVLTNSNMSHDDVGFHLLDTSVPLQPPRPTPVINRIAITLPSATLDRYVGDYEVAPNFHLLVTREATGLMVEPTGQGKAPLFAEKEMEFFFRVVDAQIVFQVDASGRTTGLVLRQNGRDLPATKVK